MAATQTEFLASDGVRLAGDTYGNDTARPVLLLHGGGQTRHAWGETAAALARAGWFAIALDLRGRKLPAAPTRTVTRREEKDDLEAAVPADWAPPEEKGDLDGALLADWAPPRGEG